MKCTWPTRIKPNTNYIPLAHVGASVRSSGVGVGYSTLALHPRGFSDDNMSVSSTQIARVVYNGGRTEREAPMRVVLRCSGI